MKKKITKIIKRFYKVIKRPEMILLPGQLAFFLVLAIIPTMTLISYGASILNLSTDFLYNFLAKAFSSDIADLMLSIPSSSDSNIKLIIVLLTCYYIASNGTSSIIVTSNTIYGVKNSNWFKRRIKAIFMAIIFVLIIVFLLVIPVFGTQIIIMLKSALINPKIIDIASITLSYLQSPIMWVFLFLLIKLIYLIAPDYKIKFSNANYGALFTTLSWIVTTYFYSIYVNNYANYKALYGGLTSICILMIWFYFLAYFFVIGMSLNFQVENEKNENK